MFKKRQPKAEKTEKREKRTGEFSAFLDQMRQSRIWQQEPNSCDGAKERQGHDLLDWKHCYHNADWNGLDVQCHGQES
jgi:hypothetical protein